MRKYQNAVPLLVLSIAANAPAAFCQTQTEIEIRGAYQASDEQPFSFTEVKRFEYQDRLVGQEASYIIAGSPSMSLYSDSGAYQGYSYVRLRGIDQTRINVTLDGVPLNEPEDQGAYFSNYPDILASLSGFQVIRGVGTSQNGTASYAGSILFSSPDLSAPQSEAGLSAGSFGSARVFAQRGVRLDNGQGLFVRASELHSDGYRRRSGNDAQSILYKWDNLDRDNNWSLTGIFGHQQNELAYIGATSQEIAEDRRSNGNAREDDNFSQSLTQIQNVRRFDSGGRLSSAIYYNHLQGNYDFDLNNFLGLPSTDELFNYDLSSHFVGAFSNYQQGFGQHRFTFGVHGNRYQRRHLGSERGLGTLYTNRGEKGEMSVFARYERTLGSWTLLADIQGRRTEFSYSGNTPLGDLGWTFINPKAGLTYLASSVTSFYYSIGRTGREPTRNDLFLGNDDLLAGEDGLPILGSTQAEHVLDHELGVRSKGQDWSIDANLFLLNFDHELALNGKLGPTGLPLTSSVSRSYRTGLEYELRWTVSPSWVLESSGSFMRARITQDGEDITPVLTPRFIGHTALEWVRQSVRFRAELRTQSGSSIDFGNTASIAGSTTLNLSMHYLLDSVDVGVHFNNALNVKAVSNGYIDLNGDPRYFVSAPANFFVNATWKL